MRTLSQDRGFTLIEVMIATVVMLVALMGLLEAMNYAAVMNMKTQQRNEGVQIAEDWMARMRSEPFGLISTSYGPKTVNHKRGGTSVNAQNETVSSPRTFTVNRATTPSPDGTQVDIGVRVSWSFKNVTTSHEVHSVRSLQ